MPVESSSNVRRAVRRTGPRPLWLDAALPVEAAVTSALRPRLGLHGENLVWTTLFGLLFAELYFLPVHGALPVPTLDGPLDLGTPAFAERRAEALGARLKQLHEGAGPALIGRSVTVFQAALLPQ